MRVDIYNINIYIILYKLYINYIIYYNINISCKYSICAMSRKTSSEPCYNSIRRSLRVIRMKEAKRRRDSCHIKDNFMDEERRKDIDSLE